MRKQEAIDRAKAYAAIYRKDFNVAMDRENGSYIVTRAGSCPDFEVTHTEYAPIERGSVTPQTREDWTAADIELMERLSK